MSLKLNQTRILILISALLMFFQSCAKDNTAPEAIIRPVRYEQVFATGGDRIRTFSGSSQANFESNLSFKVKGTINSLRISVGDKVKAGQIIAQMDTKDFRLQVQETEASLAQAQAQARNAAANYDRTRRLYENDNASLNDLDATRAQDESAKASVRSVGKKLEQANLQLDYATLKAPIDGAIAEVMVDVNENVQAGNTIAVLTSGSDFEVEVSIPEVLISQVNLGGQAVVKFDAIPGKDFPATISEVGVSATGAATTFPVTVILGDTDPNIRAGMAAQITLNFASSDQRERFLVPAVAVHEEHEKRYVFIVIPSGDGLGQVQRKNVTVGEFTGDGLEIYSGLADGDRVITAGISKLLDGMTVKLPDQKEGQQ